MITLNELYVTSENLRHDMFVDALICGYGKCFNEQGKMMNIVNKLGELKVYRFKFDEEENKIDITLSAGEE